MRKHLFFAVLMTFSVVAVGCAGKQIRVDPNDPVWKYKQEFLLKYGFFVTKKEIVSYYQDSLGVVGKENEIFNNLTTIEDVDKFVEVFMKVRDPNPGTPENEFKDEKDQRIRDIENEIFAPEMFFNSAGGLKGDLAHVYLYYGAPNQISKAQNMSRVADLMGWVYFDHNQKPLFVFLFYDKDFGHKLFKRYSGIDSPAIYMERLKEVAKFYPTSPDDYVEIEREIIQNDYERVFWFALVYNQFSSYIDVVIENGNNNKNPKKRTFGALDPPEPAALTAERAKPIILGQPGDLTGREFLNSARHSLILAELQITKNERPSFTISIGYTNVDWEIKGENAEFVLDIRISFQNKETRALQEFSARLPYQRPREEIEKKRKGINVNGVLFPVIMNILLDNIQNFAQVEEPRQTLRQLIDSLEPGTYVVNVDLRHPVTKKSAGGWREEITIK